MQLKPRPLSREPQPARDKDYLDWIRQQECIVRAHGEMTFEEHLNCGETQAAHTGRKGRGMARKACDHEALPICRYHHLDAKRAHQRVKEADFEIFHGINLEELRVKHRAMYEEEKGRKLKSP